MKYLYKTIVLLLVNTCVLAQVGINTEDVRADLHIYSNGNTENKEALLIYNSANSVVLTVKNNGYVGIGTAAPKVKLDLEGGVSNTLGLGNTTQTASQAQAGAIRYVNAPTPQLQFSNGTNWIHLLTVPIKAFVIAENTAGQIITSAGSAKDITNWNFKKDVNSNFNFVTGVFTAQRTGIYIATVSITLDSSFANADSQYELVLTGGGIGYNSLVSYLKAGASIRPNYCKGIFFLQANETISVKIYQNTGVSKTLTTQPSVNRLVIAEM